MTPEATSEDGMSEIKVGERRLVPATVLAYEPTAGEPSVSVQFPDGRIAWLGSDVLSTCTRLPPEIGVGDEVRTPRGYIHRVRAIDGELAWIIQVEETGNRYGGIWPLSDLTLVKRAEKS